MPVNNQPLGRETKRLSVPVFERYAQGFAFLCALGLGSGGFFVELESNVRIASLVLAAGLVAFGGLLPVLDEFDIGPDGAKAKINRFPLREVTNGEFGSIDLTDNTTAPKELDSGSVRHRAYEKILTNTSGVLKPDYALVWDHNTRRYPSRPEDASGVILIGPVAPDNSSTSDGDIWVDTSADWLGLEPNTDGQVQR